MNVGMFIASYFPDIAGGAEQQCRRLSEELVRQGHSVTILTTRARRDSPPEAMENGVRVIRLARVEALLGRRSAPATSSARRDESASRAPARPSLASRVAAGVVRRINLWLILFGMVRVMRRMRSEVDVWHVHVAALTAGWCGYWAKAMGIPVVCKGANLPAFSDEAGIPFRRAMQASRRRLHFIALTPEMKEDLVSSGVAAERIAIIPNGIPLASADPRPDPGAQGVVLFVANLTRPVENKAFDVLFEAWSRVHAQRSEARLLVAGAGDPTVWCQYLRERGADSSVRFAGRVSDVDALYRNALMLVLPSRREGISNALLEAQSCGVPAVVSAIPGNTFVVRDGENGLVVPVGDAEALSAGVIRLLEDSALRERMSRAAIARVDAEFRMDSVAKRVVEFYAIAGGRSG